MYVIVEIGAKQYKVKEKDVIETEKQVGREGKDITLNKILFLSKGKEARVGRSYLKGIKVVATILKQLKAKKVISYKYRRRKDSAWKKGHRQQITRIKIKEIIGA
jgi:large subunit ribosomal protein L21